MNIANLNIESGDVHRLLSAASGDAALLYIYIRCGNDPAGAEETLRLTEGRYACAAATLRQLGLWPEEKRVIIAPGERPNYTERDVRDTMNSDNSFRSMYGEVERRLGRQLSIEELKILLSLTRFMQMLRCFIHC